MRDYVWKSSLAKYIQDHIAIQKAAGLKFWQHEQDLQRFDHYYFYSGYQGTKISMEAAEGGWHMLRWNKEERRDNRQKIVSTSYVASAPCLGRVSIHPYIHSPGEWFLTCQSLHIDKHPLGSISPEEAERLAEAELVKRLEGHIDWCRSALNEVRGESDASAL